MSSPSFSSCPINPVNSSLSYQWKQEDASQLNSFSNATITTTLVILNFFFIAVLGLFISKKPSSTMAAHSMPKLSILIACCSIFITNYYLMHVSGFQGVLFYLPCFLEAWSIVLVVPIWLMCYALRAMYIIINHRLADHMLKGEDSSLWGSNLSFDLRLVLWFRKWTNNLSLGKGVTSGKVSSANHSVHYEGNLKKEMSTLMDQPNSHSMTSPATTLNPEWCSSSHSPKNETVVKVTKRILYQLLFLLFLFGLFAMITMHILFDGISLSPPSYPLVVVKQTIDKNPILTTPTAQCFSSCDPLFTKLLPISVTLIILFILILIYSIYAMRKMDTKTHLKKELIFFVAALSIVLVLYFAVTFSVNQHEFQGSGSLSMLKTFCASLFPFLGMWSFMITIALPSMFSIIYTAKPKKSSQKNQQCPSLEDILMNRKPFKLFKATLASQMCLENGLFAEDYLALVKMCIPNLERVYPTILEKQLQNHHSMFPQVCHSSHMQMEIKRLCEKYIDKNSNYELNITCQARNKVKKNLQANVYHPVAFIKVWQEIYLLMLENSYQEFIKV